MRSSRFLVAPNTHVAYSVISGVETNRYLSAKLNGSRPMWTKVSEACAAFLS
jgi:hypothetical protein